jgi:hypothetical protein
VPFVATTLQDFEREARRRQQAERDGEDREDNLGRRRGFPSRDITIGIREYSPGVRVVLDGRIYQSKGVTLNWKIPASDADVHELQVFRVAWRCRRCYASGTGLQMLTDCPRCHAGEANLRQHQYLEPAGFAVDMNDKPDNDLSYRSFVPVMRPWISAGGEPWRPLPDPRFGRYRYAAEGHLFNHTRGPAGFGFGICLRCGRAAAESEAVPTSSNLPKELSDHRRLRGGRGKGDAQCEGNEWPYAIKRSQWLGSSSSTDVFELQLVDRSSRLGVASETACLSVAVALRQALSEYLGIDEREIGFSAIPSRTDTNTACWDAVLFDTAAGGAGYVASAPEALPQIVRRAREVLQCPRDCDASCHACLLDYQTQHEMARLDRHEALQWLTPDLESALKLPSDLRLFGDATRFEFNAMPLAIAEELERADVQELRVYLGGEAGNWDPGEWSLRRWLLKWGAAKRKLRVFASGAVLQSLGVEDRSDLATIGEAAEMKLLVENSSGRPSPTGLIAEVGGPSRSVRWAVTNPLAKAPNASWGAHGPEDRIVRVAASQPLAEPAGLLASFATLRRAPAGSLMELRIVHELDGSSKDLGRQFWRLLNAHVPGLERRLSAKSFAQIEYEDRYLRSPLHLKILFEILSAAVIGAKAPEVIIRTESLRPSYHTHESLYVADDWQSLSDRRAVCQSLLGSIAEAVEVREMPKSELKHQRELRFAWGDGTRWAMRLDEGVGWLKPSRWTEFEFRSDAKAQAETLRRLTLNLETRNKSGTVFYLFPLSTK